MKPRSEWGPADETADSIRIGVLWSCMLFFGIGAGYGITNAIENYRLTLTQYREGNLRGYIRCLHPGVEMGNFDIGNLDHPIELEKVCDKRAPGE